MEWKDRVVEALRRLNPAEPPEDDCYIARNDPTTGPGWDLPERLEPMLLEGHRFRALMVGTVGVGKTTELSRWERLRPAGRRVVRLTLPAHAISTDEPKILQSIAIGLRLTMGDLGATNVPWGTIDAATAKENILLLVDGLDLLSPEDAAQVFGPNTGLVDPRLPPVVFTAPVGLLALPANVSRDARFEEVWHLPPVRVYDRKRSVNGAAIGRMVQGLQTRVEALVPGPLLHHVALGSGGVPRHAVRILRGALMAAWSDGALTADHIWQGTRLVRKDLEQGLSKEDLHVLWNTGDTGSYRGGSRLLTASAVLPYEDPDRYWLPHPLLWEAIQHGHAEWRR
ncbi:MAG: hypothetical protein ABIO70_21160 [Pseudomonadota bacterium]